MGSEITEFTVHYTLSCASAIQVTESYMGLAASQHLMRQNILAIIQFIAIINSLPVVNHQVKPTNSQAPQTPQPSPHCHLASDTTIILGPYHPANREGKEKKRKEPTWSI